MTEIVLPRGGKSEIEIQAMLLALRPPAPAPAIKKPRKKYRRRYVGRDKKKFRHMKCRPREANALWAELERLNIPNMFIHAEIKMCQERLTQFRRTKVISIYQAARLAIFLAGLRAERGVV